jgi:hypothetical protein
MVVEVGAIQLQRLISNIEKGDLDVTLKAGVIVTAPMGSLLTLREKLRVECSEVIYFTISSQPLYLVHWNDLSEKKQHEIELRKKT